MASIGVATQASAAIAGITGRRSHCRIRANVGRADSNSVSCPPSFPFGKQHTKSCFYPTIPTYLFFGGEGFLKVVAF
jgi:hypothetical protein